jgi:hypothetical protein
VTKTPSSSVLDYNKLVEGGSIILAGSSAKPIFVAR